MLSPLTSHWQFLWLLTASLLAGVMNAMAGGGSFLSFPALLGMGVPPIEANATNTVALWPGQLTSIFTLRKDVPRLLLPVVLASALAGGIAGAWVLLHTAQKTFLHLIPWLLLTAAILFGISGKVSGWLRGRAAASERLEDPAIHPFALGCALLPVCFYVGYFGAGSGFLIMTVLTLFGMQNIHQVNALKIVAATVANLCATVTFIVSGRVLWHYCLVAMVAAAVGGYVGARYARRMNGEALRAIVVVTGVGIAAYFFWRNG